MALVLTTEEGLTKYAHAACSLGSNCPLLHARSNCMTLGTNLCDAKIMKERKIVIVS